MRVDLPTFGFPINDTSCIDIRQTRYTSSETMLGYRTHRPTRHPKTRGTYRLSAQEQTSFQMSPSHLACVRKITALRNLYAVLKINLPSKSELWAEIWTSSYRHEMCIRRQHCTVGGFFKLSSRVHADAAVNFQPSLCLSLSTENRGRA